MASVGMFEHVGVNHFPRYFGRIYRVLKPGGPGAEPRHHASTRSTPDSLGSGISDFVDDYVFPAGQLTNVARVDRGHGRGKDSSPSTPNALREHYANDALALGGSPRGARGDSAAEVGDETLPHLAHLHGRVRRTPSTAAGFRCGKCWPARRVLMAGCPIRSRATTCTVAVWQMRCQIRCQVSVPDKRGLQAGRTVHIFTGSLGPIRSQGKRRKILGPGESHDQVRTHPRCPPHRRA